MYVDSVLAPRYGNAVLPFVSMRRALRSLDDIFAAPQVAALPVRLDVHEDEKAFHISADLPGLDEKQVEVTFEEGVLTLRGEKKIERSEDKINWHLTERSSGSFTRQLSLNAPIDEAAIEARFEKGVLTVTLPKKPEEPSKSRKIEIKTS